MSVNWRKIVKISYFHTKNWKKLTFLFSFPQISMFSWSYKCCIKICDLGSRRSLNLVFFRIFAFKSRKNLKKSHFFPFFRHFSSFFADFRQFSSKIFNFLTGSTRFREYLGHPRFWVLGCKWATLFVKIWLFFV